MVLRCLGSSSWRKGLGLWIGNALGLGMRELRARLCYLLVLVCLWFCGLLSRSFALVCLSLACLACLACLCFRRRPIGIGRAAFCISGVEKVFADVSI
jgi:hypothetical protein